MIITKTLEDIRWGLDATLDKAIAFLIERKSHYEAQGYSDLQIDISAYDYYGSASVDVELNGSREETADDSDQREQREEVERIRKEDADRRTFAALKAKYGDA